MHPAAIPTEKLLADCQTTRTRRGGPGGQHRNKVETAIVLTHLPTGIVGQASERRSQLDNLRMATQRLRINLALACREPLDELRQPHELWKSRTAGSQIRVSTEHDDFPAILAEALDFVAGCGFQLAPAAERLKITSSQLSRLIRSEPAAWQWLNRQRGDLGLHPMK
jgi:hypothetical protein